jgi:hypothetical protein
MFTSRQSFSNRSLNARSAPLKGECRAGVLRPKAAWLTAVLGAATFAGCALEPREGDGLVTDFSEVRITPSDAGARDAVAEVPPCKAPEAFNQHVAPLLAVKYENKSAPEAQACIDCHDGSKPKSVTHLFLMRGNDAFNCSTSVGMAATKPDKLQAEILTSSDPDRPDVVHEFKFKKPEEYQRFRDAVLMWLNVEKP